MGWLAAPFFSTKSKSSHKEFTKCQKTQVLSPYIRAETAKQQYEKEKFKKTTIQHSAVLCRSWCWATEFVTIIENRFLLKNHYHYPMKTHCVKYWVKSHFLECLFSRFSAWFCGSRAKCFLALNWNSGLKRKWSSGGWGLQLPFCQSRCRGTIL